MEHDTTPAVPYFTGNASFKEVVSSPVMAAADIGGGEIDCLAVMAEGDGAGIDAVIAIDHLEDGGLAGAGGAAEHDAFAGVDVEIDVGDDGEDDAVTQVHGEGF